MSANVGQPDRTSWGILGAEFERGDRHDMLDYYAGYRGVCDRSELIAVTISRKMPCQCLGGWPSTKM